MVKLILESSLEEELLEKLQARDTRGVGPGEAIVMVTMREACTSSLAL